MGISPYTPPGSHPGIRLATEAEAEDQGQEDQEAEEGRAVRAAPRALWFPA
jgi:hypothetical protein